MTLDSADRSLNDIAEQAKVGNFDQVLKQLKVIANEMRRASRPHTPNHMTGTRSAPPPVYEQYSERYAAALEHVKTAMTYAKAENAVAVLESISGARQALQPPKAAK